MADLNAVDTFASFAVGDLDAAQKFYSETLGLEVKKEEMGILSMKLKGGQVMIYPKGDHAPANFTVLNFVVKDLEGTVDELTAAGVKFEIYDEENLKTNEKGIADDGRGPKIAWFTDPSGNVLSVIEAS